MSRERKVKFVEVNVAANPHPRGIYESLLIRASESEGIAFGRKWYAKIAAVVKLEDGTLRGQFGVWREFNAGEPVINKKTLEQKEIGELVGDIPEGFGYPSKRFNFAFRERDHRLFVQITNDSKESIQPSAVEAGLRVVLQAAAVDLKVDVSVTIIPESDVIDRFHHLERIRKITIEVFIPNGGDVLDDEIERKVKERKEAKVQKEVRTLYVSEGADSIKLTSEILADMELASQNGSVEAIGYQAGKRVHLKTKDHPRIISRAVEAADSTIGAAIALAREN